MKIPKTMKRYCPYCKKHTEQTVTQAKKKTPGSVHPLGKGSKKRRGFGKGVGNLGTKGSKPALTKWKMTGAKTTKKTDLRLKCKVCGKSHIALKSSRAKKVEIK